MATRSEDDSLEDLAVAKAALWRFMITLWLGCRIRKRPGFAEPAPPSPQREI
jgi:hypothetical protein